MTTDSIKSAVAVAQPILNKPAGNTEQAAVVKQAAVANNGDAPAPLLAAVEKVMPKLPLALHDRAPANWNIQPTLDEDIIHATSLHTAKVFVGTRKEFTDLLRTE